MTALRVVPEVPPVRPALTMWTCMEEAGVPDRWRGAASSGAQAFMLNHLGIEEERRWQRSRTFPHVHGDGLLADKCLTCDAPFPCEGYYRDIDRGVIGGEQ